MLLLHLIMAVAAVSVLGSGLACAQGYPNRPIRLVTSGISGGSDTAARLLAPALSDALQQRLVVDNRASGVIPGEIVSRAAPDGYTLLLYNNTLWVEPLLQKTPYDATRDFAPVSLIIRRLSAEAVRFLRTRESKQRYLTVVGMESVGSSPEELAAAIRSDLTRVSKIVKQISVRE